MEIAERNIHKKRDCREQNKVDARSVWEVT